MNNLKKKKKGFTLVELMAVIAIIAILAAVLVPTVNGYITRAKKTAIINQVRTAVNAIEGKIISTDKGVVFTLDSNTGKVTAKPEDAGEPKTNANAANALQSYLQTIPKPESIANQKFEVTVKGPESSPIIQVDIGSVNVYPVASEDYKLNK